MNTWFTADSHFGHENIIRYCNRPFANASEMDAELIQGWNARVGPDDTVYHLGDFTLNEIGFCASILRRLNGKIKILPGSHDWRWLEGFSETIIYSASGHVVEVTSPLLSLEFDHDGKYPLVIVLCHYALRVWDRSHYGSWHLYGHSHGNLIGIGKSFDVGVDAMTDFVPINMDEVQLIMEGL